MMRNRTFGVVFFVPFFICVLSTCSSPEIGAQQEFDLADLEFYLSNAEIVDVEAGADLGTTDPWKVQLDDGKLQKRAMFKHAPRCRPNIPVDCYKYEIAAYELSKMLGLPIVPPTVGRSVKGTPGALQIFLEGSTALNRLKDVPDTDQFHRGMLDILVFDNLTYWQTGMDDINEDIFYHNDDGRLCRVDFSKAFHPTLELLPKEREVTQCSETMCRALEQLDESEVRERLANYLNEEEIAALIVRRDLLLAKLTPIR
jgi:hypothetical protein